MKEIRLLKPDDIEVRIQSVNKGGARLLLYKNARVDMNILDETFGPMNWQRSHSRENQNCTVSVWDDEKGQWVAKEDTGTESFTEKEKGLASDSFKRACFNWGIGRELYTAPDIFVFRNDLKKFQEKGQGFVCYDRFVVTDIKYNGRTIEEVIIRNEDTGKEIAFGNAPKQRTDYKPKPPDQTGDKVTESHIELLKKTADKKQVSLGLALAMAGVSSLEGITKNEYNEVVKVLRGM